MEAKSGGSKRPRFSAKSKTMGFSPQQKKVAELPHAPGLVGSVVEKGFSEALPQKPSPASLPQPTVLPFPVARHRSHGPHWVQQLRWKIPARTIWRRTRMRCIMIRTAVGNQRVATKSAKKQGKEANLALNQPQDEAAQDVSMRDSYETRITTEAEQKPVVDSMECDTPIPKNRHKPIMGESELKVSEIDDGGATSLMGDIHAENVARLADMSTDEISEARAEIMEKMNPSLIEMLKKRGRQKLEKKQVAKPERKKEEEKLESTRPAGNGKTSRSKAGDWIPYGVESSHSWKVWSERVERVRLFRFSLDGNLLEIESSPQPCDGKNANYSQYNATNVAERDFLRTEGDPAAVGYTINEAVALIRSMVPGQRALALQLLASILNKALQNLQKMDIGQNVGEISSSEKFVDWQAVWAFVLGPEPQTVLSLRIALDDNHDSVVLACAKVIQLILSCDMNENFFDISEKSCACEKDICTAPVFRARPELDGGFLHGGFWKYNTKPSNIIPCSGETENDESEGTIQDDVTVAGQDVAAGLIRMGILPRICYLLEMDPLQTLEDYLVSILIALARHSPQSADAILRCPRLIPTVIKMFTKQGSAEIQPSRIKATALLKVVLCKYNKQTCLDFVKRGVFQQAMWHWYKSPFTLEQWIKSGKEQCKFTSSLMVEQLRLWKVCILYGFCIPHFADYFPVMCLWLSPPKFEKLIGNDVLSEFMSVTREVYLVLGALAQRLPLLHSIEQLNKDAINLSNDYVEAWSWSYVVPVVDFATNWLELRSIPYVSLLIDSHSKGNMSHMVGTPLSSLLWVISAILHMLHCMLSRIVPEDIDDENKTYTNLPWLPEFVPKLGLKIVKHGFFDFSCDSNITFQEFPSNGGSLAKSLCYLRDQNSIDVSLSSISCLEGLVHVAVSVDRVVQRARPANHPEPIDGNRTVTADKILEEGITKWACSGLKEVLSVLMNMASSEWPKLQSIEMFGRGGPAPGIGFGWGSSGGGFWSLKCMLVQWDAQLILDLIKIFPIFPKNATKPDAAALRRISSVLEVCLIAGPRDRDTLAKALDILFQASVLKNLDFCIHYFVHHTEGLRSFDWKISEEDYTYFSGVLKSHFTTKWLGIKRKSSSKEDRNGNVLGMSKKGEALETIHEEESVPEQANASCSSLLVEWAHQRLPLPVHWFLSAICIIGDPKSTVKWSFNEVLDVARSGLFFLLGLESIASFLRLDLPNSPILGVPLVWKLHSLSTALHANMDVLEEEKSKDVFDALQEQYGKHVDHLRRGRGNVEILNFKTTIHESYSTFVENLVEQFAAISYGDVIYGRQVAIYLHRTVEAAIRLAAWNSLSNARVLEILPPLEKCIGEPEGYLEPVEDNEGILEAYSKSWTSGILDRAAARESVAFSLALHHLSCFIFYCNASEKLPLRNKLGMLRKLVQHKLTVSEGPLYRNELDQRFEVMKDACEGNSSLLAEVEKLRSSL
uniref:Transcriptional elongation regulator MINIYO n=1 Tax=Ananas comosus var. bracteatus TaxID=296719 RepID=A0A6V7QRL3_ANACO